MHSFQSLGARMFTKMHFLTSHLDYFPQNCNDYSEERGERFHQEIRMMEELYHGHWDINILVDYCWCLRKKYSCSITKKESFQTPFCLCLNLWFTCVHILTSD